MASKIGLSHRRDRAMSRLRPAMAALTERFGAGVEIPTQDRDPDALAVRQLEAMADFAEALVTRAGPAEGEVWGADKHLGAAAFHIIQHGDDVPEEVRDAVIRVAELTGLTVVEPPAESEPADPPDEDLSQPVTLGTLREELASLFTPATEILGDPIVGTLEGAVVLTEADQEEIAGRMFALYDADERAAGPFAAEAFADAFKRSLAGEALPDDPANDDSGESDTAPNLQKMTRAELDAYASELGITNPHLLPNMDAVITVINVALAGREG